MEYLAFIFGLVTCLTDGYGFYTYPFDYLIGFGSIAVFGFFSRLNEGEGGVLPERKVMTTCFIGVA